MPNLPKAKIAVIGGTGLENIEGLTDIQQVNIDTPFGKPSDAITLGKLDGVGIAFLPRHGRGHFISPTELPARANIYALKSLGVEQIIAVCSCGSFKQDYCAGTSGDSRPDYRPHAQSYQYFLYRRHCRSHRFCRAFLPGTQPNSLRISQSRPKQLFMPKALMFVWRVRLSPPARNPNSIALGERTLSA